MANQSRANLPTYDTSHLTDSLVRTNNLGSKGRLLELHATVPTGFLLTDTVYQLMRSNLKNSPLATTPVQDEKNYITRFLLQPNTRKQP
jgi:hypothetical protein